MRLATGSLLEFTAQLLFLLAASAIASSRGFLRRSRHGLALRFSLGFLGRLLRLIVAVPETTFVSGFVTACTTRPVLAQGFLLLRRTKRRTSFLFALSALLRLAFTLAFALALLSFAFPLLAFSSKRGVKGRSNAFMKGLLNLFLSFPNDVLFHEVVKWSGGWVGQKLFFK